MLSKERQPEQKSQRQISLSTGRNSMSDLYFAWMQGSLSSNSNLDKGLPVLQPSGSLGEGLWRKQNKTKTGFLGIIFGCFVWIFFDYLGFLGICFCLFLVLLLLLYMWVF